MGSTSSSFANEFKEEVKDEEEVKEVKLLQLPLVIVVGPVGYGKSLLGKQLAHRIGGNHIDGDVLNLSSESEVLCLGGERTPYSFYQVIETWMRGVIPVVSAGGGIFHNLAEVMSKMFPGYTLNLVVFVPAAHGAVYPAWKVDEVVTRRLRSRVWTLPSGQTEKEFIGKIQTLSSANVKFANLLISMVTLGKVCAYPSLDPETAAIYNTSDAVTYIQSQSWTPPNMVNYKQYRILTTCSDMSRYGHITLDFYGGQSLPSKTASELVADGRRYVGEVDATLLTVGECMLIVVPGTATVCVYDDDKHVKTHVTVKAGPHEPAKMSIIASAYLRGEKTVKVDDAVYNFAEATAVPTKLTMHGVFVMI